jgi:hypothetical protein
VSSASQTAPPPKFKTLGNSKPFNHWQSWIVAHFEILSPHPPIGVILSAAAFRRSEEPALSASWAFGPPKQHETPRFRIPLKIMDEQAEFRQSEVEGISRLIGPARTPNCTTCHPERSMIVRRTIMRSRRIPITRTALNVLGFHFHNHRNSKP